MKTIRGYKHWLVTMAGLLAVGAGLGFSSVEHSPLPSPTETLTDISFYPADSSKLLIASGETLYLRDVKKNWKRLLYGSMGQRPIRQLILHPQLKDKIFIVSDDGVSEFDLQKRKVKSIFREGFPQNRALGLAFRPDQPDDLYLGTDRGLFLSGDGGKTWLRPFRWPENQHVEFVAYIPFDSPLLLIGTSRELFFSTDGGENFESGFSLSFHSQEESPEETEDGESRTSPPRFTSFASSAKTSAVWIGTSDGVYESKDAGVDWERLPSTGLEVPQIIDLAYSENTGGLIAATPRGIAKYLPGERRWENLPVSLASPPASIALQNQAGNKEVLLIASGKELLEWIIPSPETPGSPSTFVASPGRIELFQKLIRLELTVREVQKAAIRYGDLGNGKIKRWQWGSRMRSFIPRLSAGKDLSRSTNIDIDRSGTNNPDFFISGPDDRHRSWNVDATWELGDLLYSSAQTSIDSRTKLLVELRESILSEVTRIYFERRRTQLEIAFSPPQTPQDYFDALLRLDELTAQLDALTNGFMSRRIQEIETANPELQDLWKNAGV